MANTSVAMQRKPARSSERVKSLHTYVEWHYLGHDDFNMSSMLDQIDVLVSRRGLPRETTRDLKQLVECGRAKFALDSVSVIEVIAEIARLAPKLCFSVRGLGEASRMIWVREYEGGRERFAFGPPAGAEAAAERATALFDAQTSGARAPWHDVPAAAELEASRKRLVTWFRSKFADATVLAALIDPGAGLTMVDVNKTYETSSGLTREQIVGKSLFKLFPDNPYHPNADGVSNLLASLRAVSESGQPHDMQLQRYDTRDAEGVWTERYWRPVNTPLHDDQGRLILLLHVVQEATGPAHE